MKRIFKFGMLSFTLGILLSAVFSPDIYAAPKEGGSKQAGEEKKNFKPGELLVKFKRQAKQQTKRRLHDKHGSKKIKDFPRLGIDHIRLKKGLTVEQAIKLYRLDPNVEYAEPNYLYHTNATIPDDFHFSELWGMANTGQTGGTAGADIQATDAWDITTGDSSVIVAVIDTGVDYNHEDLAANVWVNSQEIAGNGIDDDGNGYVDDIYGIDTVNLDSDPLDDHGHGTHVSGTIGAVGNNAIGVAGVNWHVKVMNCKFLSSGGSGSTAGAIECLDYIKALKDRGENIVTTSNSWGCLGCYSQALADAIDAQRQSGMLFIAAAGNANSDNDDNLQLPANYPSSYELPNIIAVAATDHNDSRAVFSSFGRRSVDVGAPGVDIVSLRAAGTDMYGDGNHFIPAGDPDAKYYMASGTSMATPHVAGLAALLRSQAPAGNWIETRNLILSGGSNIASMDGITLTGKRINAFGSLSCVDSPVFSALQYPKWTEDYVIGTATILSVLSINCASPVGPVTVTTSGGTTISLLDDGVAPDMAANDGIFTASWIPTLASDVLTFSSAAGGSDIEAVPVFADLIITGVAGVTAAGTGQPLQVVNTVRNQGERRASAFTVGIYLSSDATITTSDMLIGSRYVSGLAAGADDTQSYTRVTIPAGIPSGTYYLGAIADADNIVDEVTVEDNNSLAGNAIAISEVYADLAVTAVAGPSAAPLGQQVTTTATVTNQGDGWAWQNFTVTFYLSTDATITTDDIALYPYHIVSGFPPGSQITISKLVTIPDTLVEGTYYIGVIADKENYVINELDRTNNAVAGNQIIVSSLRPDLVVSSVSGSVADNELSVTTTVRNQGELLSVPSVAGIYLSTDTIITADDHFIGTQAISGLAVGGEESVTFTGTVPESVPNGDYYVGVIANQDGALLESDTTNNALAGNLLTLNWVHVAPDLVVTAVSGTLVGDQLTVTTTMRNLGLTGAGSFYYRVYLSPDTTISATDTYYSDYWGTLAAGTEATKTLTVTVPVSLASGNYYVGSVADTTGLIAETDENNNTLFGNQININKDLIVTAVSGTLVGDQLTINSTFRNQGTNSLVSFLAGFYLSTDATITDTDIYLGYSFPGVTVAGGAEVTLTYTTTISPTLPSGSYYVGVIADSDQRIVETDETNNTLSGNQVTVP